MKNTLKFNEIVVELECVHCLGKPELFTLEVPFINEEGRYNDYKDPESFIFAAYGNRLTQQRQGTWLCDNCGSSMVITRIISIDGLPMSQFRLKVKYDGLSPKCFCSWGFNECQKSDKECDECIGNSKNIIWY